jgi:hypothetical protein
MGGKTCYKFPHYEQDLYSYKPRHRQAQIFSLTLPSPTLWHRSRWERVMNRTEKLSGCWQCECYTGPLTRGAGNVDLSLVCFYQRFCYGKSQAIPFILTF